MVSHYIQLWDLKNGHYHGLCDNYVENYSKSRKGKEAFLRMKLGEEDFKKIFNNEDKKLLKTISKCDLNLLQQHSIPHGPIPPIILALSLSPIWRNSIRQCNWEPSIFNNSLKSTLCSAR